MKQKFSIKWTGSKQPRKQRKYRANAPLHVRHKLMSANLSKDLRKKYGKRNIPLRKDDNVRIMKGEFKGKTGKIETINQSKLKVGIIGMTRNKKDGSKVGVWFDPSNLQIKELNLEDMMRVKSLNRVGISKSKEEISSEKNSESPSEASKIAKTDTKTKPAETKK